MIEQPYTQPEVRHIVTAGRFVGQEADRAVAERKAAEANAAVPEGPAPKSRVSASGLRYTMAPKRIAKLKPATEPRERKEKLPPVPKPPYVAHRRVTCDDVKRLHSDGRTVAEIAVLLKCALGPVYDRLSELGIPRDGVRIEVNADDRYGKLVIVSPAGRFHGRGRRFLCLCDCGEETYAFLRDLRKGGRTSCGCAAGKISAERGAEFAALRRKRVPIKDIAIQYGVSTRGVQLALARHETARKALENERRNAARKVARA